MQSIMQKVKNHGKAVTIKMFFCLGLYSMVLAFGLVNTRDGMWNGPYFFGGNWELSIGRWFIRYWDYFLHMSIHVNPFTTIVALFFFVLGTEVLIDLLEIECGSWKDYLISFLFLGNMIICVTISYLYTSRVFGIAFLFSMICVWCIKHGVEKRWLVIAASLSLNFMMGIYQAYLGCVVVAALAVLLLMIMKNEENDRILYYIGGGFHTGNQRNYSS